MKYVEFSDGWSLVKWVDFNEMSVFSEMIVFSELGGV